jgi:transposase
MRDKDLYAKILGLDPPWVVREVKLDMEEGEVVVHVEHDRRTALRCPECGGEAPGYDFRERRWRHLDTCQYRTILVAEVPRCRCPEHGVHQVRVPWGETGSRFTTMFEALVIDWLRETSMTAVGRNLDLTWDQIDRIMQRAVKRGLERREKAFPEHIGVDETSFKKRHAYVTIVQDQESGDVLYVGDGRGREGLDPFYKGLDEQQLMGICSVAMDMHQPYIQSTLAFVPEAEKKIAFDKFHIAKHLGDAVDKVRRREHKELQRRGDETLKGTKYVWLQNPENMKAGTAIALEDLRDLALRTARAWAIKEFAMTLWTYVRRGWALRAWKRWLCWAQRCRLESMVKVARTIRDHLWGIINAIVLRVTGASNESVNAKIQKLKKWACGYRNRERFRTAILFHFGGLDLYPAGILNS